MTVARHAPPTRWDRSCTACLPSTRSSPPAACGSPTTPQASRSSRGCCTGLEDWRDWHQVLDGRSDASFGHDPDPCAQRYGDTVRLTVDAEQSNSPVIELPVADLRRLLAGAEHDLNSFLTLATDWTAQHLPGHAAWVTAAFARALALPRPEEPPPRNPEAHADTA